MNLVYLYHKARWSKTKQQQANRQSWMVIQGFTRVVLIDDKNNGSTNDLPMTQIRESKRGAPALAPIFDGLHCFETFVSTNSMF